MTTPTPRPTIDTDRLALSEECYQLAENFTVEANMWKLPEAKKELSRVALTMAELGRGIVSGAAEPVRADAFIRAAALILGNVVATRRFFTAIVHEPSAGR